MRARALAGNWLSSGWTVLLVGVAACGTDVTPDDGDLEVVVQEGPGALSNVSAPVFEFYAQNAMLYTCRLDGKIIGECKSPMTLPALVDGPHVLEIAPFGHHGAFGDPLAIAWLVDTGVPDTELVAGPGRVDDSTFPRFDFASPDADVTGYECAVDDDRFTPCESPALIEVAGGAREIQIRALDGAGNVDPSPVVYTWLVVTNAPKTVLQQAPRPEDITGRSVSITFSSVSPSSTFKCQLDDGLFSTCVSPVTFPGLQSGAHTVTVRASSAGVTELRPPQATWTVDGDGPSMQLLDSPHSRSNARRPVFAFSVGEGAAVECQIDGVESFGPCTSPWFPAVDVPDGLHVFRARSFDGFANPAEIRYQWSVDPTAPGP